MTPATHVCQLSTLQRPGRVLVVDPYAQVRMLVAKLLTGAGYTVVCATDGEEALAIIATSSSFDLLITTLNIAPDMRGDDLVSRARAHTPAIQAIIMVSPLDQPWASTALDGWGIRVLCKPFLPSELLAMVRATHLGIADADGAIRTGKRTLARRGNMGDQSVSSREP